MLANIARLRLAMLVAIFATMPAPSTAQVEAPSLLTEGHPFVAVFVGGAVLVSVTANGRPGSATGLRVFPDRAGADGVSPCLQPLPSQTAMGVAATSDARTVAIAAGDAGLIVLDGASTIGGCGARPATVSMGAGSRPGSIDVALTRDGRFAFVANEYGVAGRDADGRPIPGHVAVVAIAHDERGAPIGGRVVNRIVTGGQAVTGVTLSPDGRRLYVTSEIARPGSRAANSRMAILAHGDCRQGGGPARPSGLLTAIDVDRATTAAPDPIVAATAAGCAPVRTVVSSDGGVVWVAARGDDRILAFSTAMLETEPGSALLGAAASGGAAPIGLALFDGGRRLAVANSNRFGGPGARGGLAILDANPKAAIVSERIPASYFPRSVEVAGDDVTLLLTDYDGGRVQVVTPSGR